FGFELRTRGRRLAHRGVDAACRILGRKHLFLAVLDHALDAPEAREQIRGLAIDKVRAVELGRDLNRKAQLPPRGIHAFLFWNRAQEIAAQPDEAVYAALQHASAAFDGVEALLARRLEAVLFGQAI